MKFNLVNPPMSGRHLTTRINKNQKLESPVGKPKSECCGSSKAFQWKIIDHWNDAPKLTIEELHIRQRRPALNTRDELRVREWTIKF